MGQSRPNKKDISSRIEKVALYARVSSEAQDVDLSISAQLKAMRKYAQSHKWKVTREYKDEAKSARTDKRPAFKEMIADALRGDFSRVLVWKFSRFARNRRDSIIYKSLLRKHGCDVVSVNEKIEDTPEGHLLEGMIEVIDQFYSDNMAGDIKRGMREAIERGFSVGRRLPDGLARKAVKDGDRMRNRLVPDKKRAYIVKEIFERYDRGDTVISIVGYLNGKKIETQCDRPWDTKNIYRILRNPIYAGMYAQEGEILNEQYCKPLVSRKVFERVQARLDARTPEGATSPRALNSDYLLAGLLKCGLCGSPCKGEKATGHGGEYRYYLCSGRSRKRICDAPRIPKALIEDAVLARISRHILSRANVERLVELMNESMKEAIGRKRKELGAVRSTRASAENALTNLYAQCEKSPDAFPLLKSRIDKRQKQVEELKWREISLSEGIERAQSHELPNKGVVRRAVTQLRKTLGSGGFLKQRGFVRSLVQRMEINPCSGEVKIFYTFPVPKLRSDWEQITLAGIRQNRKGSALGRMVVLVDRKSNLFRDVFIVARTVRFVSRRRRFAANN